MGYFTKEPVENRGVVFKKRAVGYFRGGRHPSPRPRQTKSPASTAFRAVVLRTTAPGVPLYGYRHLSTVLGRWVSRDPIGERIRVIILPSASLRVSYDLSMIFPHLYAFISNDPIGHTDLLGLKVVNNGTCPVVVKPENDGDGPEIVPPGGSYEGAHDGVYPCCRGDSCPVFKTVTGIDVTIPEYGYWHTSGGSFKQKAGQICIGGCKSEKFLDDNPNWPSLETVGELCDQWKAEHPDDWTGPGFPPAPTHPSFPIL